MAALLLMAGVLLAAAGWAMGGRTELNFRDFQWEWPPFHVGSKAAEDQTDYEDGARGLEALMRLYAPKNLDDWVDNESAQSILKLGLRSMQTMHSSGKIGYSIIDGKFFYPMSEIDRVLKQSYVNDGGQGARADFG